MEGRIDPKLVLRLLEQGWTQDHSGMQPFDISVFLEEPYLIGIKQNEPRLGQLILFEGLDKIVVETQYHHSELESPTAALVFGISQREDTKWKSLYGYSLEKLMSGEIATDEPSFGLNLKGTKFNMVREGSEYITFSIKRRRFIRWDDNKVWIRPGSNFEVYPFSRIPPRSTYRDFMTNIMSRLDQSAIPLALEHDANQIYSASINGTKFVMDRSNRTMMTEFPKVMTKEDLLYVIGGLDVSPIMIDGKSYTVDDESHIPVDGKSLTVHFNKAIIGEIVIDYMSNVLKLPSRLNNQ